MTTKTLALLACLCLFVGCSTTMSPTKERELFSKAKYQPNHRILTIDGHKIHYVWVGDTTLSPLLFVHGSPGSWDDYIKYMQDSALLMQYYIGSVDRPGFGQSDYGQPMVKLQDQSKLIGAVLTQFGRGKQTLLVGHSYGGPLVVRAAMDYQSDVSSLLLIAAAVDPALEEKEWFRPVVRGIKWIIPDMLTASNEELAHLKPDLEEMMPLWRTLTLPVVDIHGTKDVLVPYANLAFAQQHLTKVSSFRPITLDKVNHFIPWSHYEVVKDVLLKR